MAKGTADTSEVAEALKGWIQTFMVASWQDTMRFVKAKGLSVPQFGVLMHLHDREGCGVTDIAGDMDITSPAASQLVDRLVQQGLVGRREDPRDRRARSLSLTSAGRALVEQGTAERYRWVEALVGALSPEQRGAVAEVLPVLLEATRALGSEGNRPQ